MYELALLLLELPEARELIFTPAEVDGEPSAIAIEFTLRFDPPPPVATLRGRLFSRRSARPLKDAVVSINALDVEATTGKDGRFTLLVDLGAADFVMLRR